MVIVIFPASIAKVEQIAGKEAANRVRTYIEEIQETRTEEKQEETPLSRGDKGVCEDTIQSNCNWVNDVDTSAHPLPSLKRRVKNAFSLRANLLRWATFTPDLGIEYRIHGTWGILINGTYTNLGWKNKTRRYKVWKVSPEVRYYIGKEHKGFLGAMYHTGEFNYKLGETGKKGDYQGGGITGGYVLPLNKALSLDFHGSLGYTRAEYDNYLRIGEVNVLREHKVKNYWGVNQLGVSLIWKLK